MDILGIQNNIGKAIMDAPGNFFLGLAHAGAFVPDKIKGMVLFGESVWNGFTPEEQATIEAAVRKAVIAAAKAYVGKSSPVA